MSLDISLKVTGKHECTCEKCGNTHNTEKPQTVFDYNITHNLNNMADEAGIYYHLWRPEELNITKAGQLVENLKDGLKLLRSNPERFKKFQASNGWGTYEGLVLFVESYLEACEEYPDAIIWVSR